MNYLDMLDPDFGKYTIRNDIIVAPFWKKEFCEYLINQTKQNKDKFETISDVDETIHYLNLSSFDCSLVDQIGAHFTGATRNMLAREWHLPQHNIKRIYTPYILWYEMGKFVRYWKHTDRMLVSSNIKLNDDYTGCNIHFPRQNFSTETIPIGHAVFWPGDLTHPHYVDDLTEGEKFSMCIFVPGSVPSSTETVWGR